VSVPLPPAQTVAHRVGTDVTLDLTSDEAVTGWAIRYRLYDAAGNVLATKTVGSGITITGTHTYSVALTDGTTYNLTVGTTRRYVIDRTNLTGRAPLAYGPHHVKDIPH
jgi:hypothetical protein